MFPKIFFQGVDVNVNHHHDEQKQVLQALIQQEAMLKGEHAALEEQWLTQQAALEAIEDAAD